MYFVPQKPVLRYDTLKAVLAYPDLENTYTHEQYVEVLRAIGDMDKFVLELDKKRAWSKTFSLGEQQRIAFARLLLKKPDWLFLDEATASLDEENENHMYALVKQRLTTTTFISIGHRSTIDRHHDRVLRLDADDQKRITARDIYCFFGAASPTAQYDGSVFMQTASNI